MTRSSSRGATVAETEDGRPVLTGEDMVLTDGSKETVVQGTRLPKTAYYVVGGFLILVGGGLAVLGLGAG